MTCGQSPAAVEVDDSLRCVGAPWAVGGCADTDAPPLTPAANAAANAAARHAVQSVLEEADDPFSTGPIPTALIHLARVGRDAEEAEGHRVRDVDLGTAGSVAKLGRTRRASRS